MKLYFFCIALCAQSTHSSDGITTNHSTPRSNQPATKPIAKVDPDTQVVTETMSTLITALATFSQNPNNPVIAGACALQALGAFIKMLIQIFDDAGPTRTKLSEHEVEQWFMNLPKDKQLQIMRIIYAYIYRCKQF
jgi:hypothetical protein